MSVISDRGAQPGTRLGGGRGGGRRLKGWEEEGFGGKRRRQRMFEMGDKNGEEWRERKRKERGKGRGNGKGIGKFAVRKGKTTDC